MTMQLEERAFIKFQIGGSFFAIEIEKVIEVSELLTIVKYPEAMQWHLGIINLRGHITPILKFHSAEATTVSRRDQVTENRILILEMTPGKRFGVLVSSPKKISLDQNEMTSCERVLSIEGSPVRLLSEQNFPAIIDLSREEQAA